MTDQIHAWPEQHLPGHGEEAVERQKTAAEIRWVGKLVGWETSSLHATFENLSS